VFSQWNKGIGLATGDYVWIAEADDLSDVEFLEKVLPAFSDKSVVMSYSQSKQIDADGKIIAENYFDYVSDISTQYWSEDYLIDGDEEIKRSLAIKNTIPNVSAAVFNRKELSNCLSEHLAEIKSMKVAGDWLTYLYLLMNGKIAYSSEPLNSHRRHESGVTLGNLNKIQLDEISTLQKKAGELVALDSNIAEAAASYLDRLSQQLGAEDHV
jgi:hypothetical protein